MCFIFVHAASVRIKLMIMMIIIKSLVFICALHSMLLEWRSQVDVSHPPGEVHVVGQDVTGESEPLLPFGHPSPPQPDPQDRSGDAPVAAPGPVCLSGCEAVGTVGPCDLRTPVDPESQEEGVAWSPPAGSSVS